MTGVPAPAGPTRDLELSLFPDVKPARPVGPLLGSVFAGSNADLIAAVAPMWLTGSVLDVTYGDGKWWTRYRPEDFTYHDLHKVDGVDFRHLPHRARAFDTVCFDPPYVTSGSLSANHEAGEFRQRYGIDRVSGYGQETDLLDLILAGLTECARVTRRWLLVKCMEFTSSRRFHDMPYEVKARALSLGLTSHDVIVHHTGPGLGGHNIVTPIRARRHHSYLLVFEVPSGG